MMNLKEAFRFQNVIDNHMYEISSLLRDEDNLTKTQITYYRHKVMADAEDETVLKVPEWEYADQITSLVAFWMFLLNEKEKLSAAIRTAKNNLPIDMDSETNLNSTRQNIAATLKRMADLRSSERKIKDGGIGRRFNTDGEQVTYKCDVKHVTTINFDRNVIRKAATQMYAKAGEISTELDRCLINGMVEYDCPFDVNDSFANIFEDFLAQQAEL